MSWWRDSRKYKKLVKELIYQNSELDFQKEVLKDIKIKFNDFYRNYCTENNIDMDNLDVKNKQDILDILKKTNRLQEVEDGMVVSRKRSKIDKESAKQFSKIYKLVAKKIHPDVFSQRMRTKEIEEKEEMFKIASGSFQDQDWAGLMEISDALNISPIMPANYTKVLMKEIEKIKEKINFNTTTYHWKFYECEGDEGCKKKLIKLFINNLKK